MYDAMLDLSRCFRGDGGFVDTPAEFSPQPEFLGRLGGMGGGFFGQEDADEVTGATGRVGAWVEAVLSKENAVIGGSAPEETRCGAHAGGEYFLAKRE